MGMSFPPHGSPEGEAVLDLIRRKQPEYDSLALELHERLNKKGQLLMTKWDLAMLGFEKPEL